MSPRNKATLSEGDDDEANMEIDLPEEDHDIRPINLHIDDGGDKRDRWSDEFDQGIILEEFE